MSPADPSGGQVLALDLGTSSVRAVVCDAQANVVPGALARREVEPWQDDDGRAEVDAVSYVDALIECLDELALAGWLRGIAHVATASQWHSVLAVDPADPARKPLSAVLPWLDTRAQPDPERGPSDPEAFHARSGTWHHSLYWTAKIPWLRDQLGTDRSARFIGLPDYVRAVLLADDSTSLSLASGAGMLDLAPGVWDAEALDIAGVTATDLPTITNEPGRLADSWRQRWPDLADAWWHPVVGDGAASNLGTGCGDDSVVALTVGTSAALRVVHDASAAAPPWEVWRYRVDADRLVSGIAMSGGGVLHAWLSDLFGDDAMTELPVDPGTHGLVSVPMHAGSRPPSSVPAGSGAVFGLSLRTSEAQLRAATLEGVCLESARALDILRTCFDRELGIVLGGGAIDASPWWQRAFAATFAQRVQVADNPEVGARGAAALALGIELTPTGHAVTPTPTDQERMRERRADYIRLREYVGAG